MRESRCQPARLIARALLPLLMLGACAPTLPDGVLGEDDMEDILYDYHIAQAMAETSYDSIDYRCYAYVHKVFEKHGITEAQFDSSMVWYSANAGKMHGIYERVNERLTAEIALANQNSNIYASLTAHGDTANIWAGANLAILQQGTIDNRFTFRYEADSTFHQRDKFILRADARFVMRDGPRKAIAALLVTCEGDSVMSVVRDLSGDRPLELSVEANPGLSIKSVSGFVYLPSTAAHDGQTRRLFLVNPMLIRIHRP